MITQIDKESIAIKEVHQESWAEVDHSCHVRTEYSSRTICKGKNRPVGYRRISLTMVTIRDKINGQMDTDSNLKAFLMQLLLRKETP